MRKGDHAIAHTLAAAALLLFAFPSDAETFSWELTGALRNAERSNDAEVETGGLEATYFFRPVDDTGVPLSLAPFLSRESHMTAGVERVEPSQSIAIDPLFGATVPVSSLTYGMERVTVSGRRIWEETGWFAGGGVRWDDPYEETNNLIDFEIEGRAFAIVGGKYLGASTAIQLSMSSARSSTRSEFAGCGPPECNYYGPSTFDPFRPTRSKSTFHMDDHLLSVTHAGGGENLRYSISGRILSRNSKLAGHVTYLADDTGDSVDETLPLTDRPTIVPVLPYYGLDRDLQALEVEGELFPTARIGIRLGYMAFDDTVFEARYQFGTTWFFRPRLAIEFSAARLDYEYRRGPDSDRDEAFIRLTGRF